MPLQLTTASFRSRIGSPATRAHPRPDGRVVEPPVEPVPHDLPVIGGAAAPRAGSFAPVSLTVPRGSRRVGARACGCGRRSRAAARAGRCCGNRDARYRDASRRDADPVARRSRRCRARRRHRADTRRPCARAGRPRARTRRRRRGRAARRAARNGACSMVVSGRAAVGTALLGRADRGRRHAARRRSARRVAPRARRCAGPAAARTRSGKRPVLDRRAGDRRSTHHRARCADRDLRRAERGEVDAPRDAGRREQR